LTAAARRGFVEGPGQDVGWTFTHADGFRLELNASGRFRLTISGGEVAQGAQCSAEHILTRVDEEAAKL
jgi:hypothetical protein